jgi:hypothetical protein
VNPVNILFYLGGTVSRQGERKRKVATAVKSVTASEAIINFYQMFVIVEVTIEQKYNIFTLGNENNC